MQSMNNRYRGNYLISVNQPMIYQVQWTGTGVNENYTPAVTGDLVNVVFEIYSKMFMNHKYTKFPGVRCITDFL